MFKMKPQFTQFDFDLTNTMLIYILIFTNTTFLA